MKGREIKMNQNELYHYGIKGMKWGVRKSPQRSSEGTGKRKKKSLFGFGRDKPKSKSKSSKKTSSESEKKTVTDMSDDELRRAVQRLQMEKQYKDLSPKQINHGRELAKRVLNNVFIPAAEDTAKQLVKSKMVKKINEVFDLDDELKVYTNNKKKK